MSEKSHTANLMQDMIESIDEIARMPEAERREWVELYWDIVDKNEAERALNGDEELELYIPGWGDES